MVGVYFFLFNENHRPIYDSPGAVNVSDSIDIVFLRDKIQEYLSRNYIGSFQELVIWQCTDSAVEFPEDDIQGLEKKIKHVFQNVKVRKWNTRTTLRDLHLRDNEYLLVEVSVTRSIFYLTVDQEMRRTCEVVSEVVATRISQLIAEVKEKNRHDEVIVWRSIAKKLSRRTALGKLTEMINQIDFDDHEQATQLSNMVLATDVDSDDVLIVQVIASDDDNLLPLPSDVNLNEDFAKTYSGIRFVKSPSTNSKSAEYRKNQSNHRNIIYDGLCAPQKSAPNTSAPPINIYHPIFSQFIRGANDPSIDPDPSFLNLVRKFMAKACNVGQSEQISSQQMRKQLADILRYQMPVESNNNDTRPDGVIMFNNSNVRTPMVIAEFKRTLGEGGCDPSIQAGNSMRAKLGQEESKLIVDKCCCPVFMLAGGGPWFCVLGGVFVNRFIVQRLTDMMWIGFAATHEDHRVYHVAKVLLSLKNSLQDLERFYNFIATTDKIPDFNAQAVDPHPRHFPYPHSFVDSQDNLVVFEYLGRLEADMRCVTFRAKIKDTGEAVVVKFVDRYGAEVHRFLAEQGHAPQLLYYGPLPDRTIYDTSEAAPDDEKPMNAGYRRLGPAVAPEMKMVVMEYIPRSKPCLDDLSLSYSKISAVLKSLHVNGYVFGDLRGPNVMFDANEEVKFIDFDWAGRYDIRDLSPEQQEDAKKTWVRFADAEESSAEEQDTFATYPIGISFAISWAKGVNSCLPILPKHDTEMLDKLHKGWQTSGGTASSSYTITESSHE